MDRNELANRVSAVMAEMNSICLACRELGTLEGQGASDKLGKAWALAYDSRQLLQRVPVL